jgi:GST-like protein
VIELHYLGSPNGIKIALMLEELGWDYRLIVYDIFAGDHLTQEFRTINPNNKVPAIVDTDPDDGGEPFAVFETGAILVYLAEKSGRFLPESGRRRSLALQWLAWQISAMGPMMGQARHFISYAPEDQSYGAERYRKESRRLFNVLEYRLQQSSYLADEYSIADIASWPWAKGARLLGIEMDSFPAVARWSERIEERPAVRRLLARDDLRLPEHYLQMRRTLTDDEWSNLFGDRMHSAARP